MNDMASQPDNRIASLATPKKRPPRLPEGVLVPAQVKRIGTWGKSVSGLLKRCYLRQASPRQAIKAQCLDCCAEDKRAIRECADRCCPLWHFRPYQRASAMPQTANPEH